MAPTVVDGEQLLGEVLTDVSAWFLGVFPRTMQCFAPVVALRLNDA